MSRTLKFIHLYAKEGEPISVEDGFTPISAEYDCPGLHICGYIEALPPAIPNSTCGHPRSERDAHGYCTRCLKEAMEKIPNAFKG